MYQHKGGSVFTSGIIKTFLCVAKLGTYNIILISKISACDIKFFREAERRAKQMMRSPSISREVTANKILSGLNTSNNARRRSRGQQPHQRVQRNSRVAVHPVSTCVHGRQLYTQELFSILLTPPSCVQH